jgi:hypothetical protein
MALIISFLTSPSIFVATKRENHCGGARNFFLSWAINCY